MAQASSVQREPSMEEILASIRRIIEDSDTQRKEDEDSPTAARDKRDKGSLERPERSVRVVEVEAFRAEARSVPESTPESPELTADRELEAPRPEEYPAGVSAVETPVTEAPAVPRTLAEVQAAVAEEALTEGAAFAAISLDEPSATVPPPIASRVEAAPGEMALELDIERELSASALELERAPEAAPAAASAPPPAAAQTEAPLEARGGGGPILSDFAGRQVAAAFGELTEAFASTRKKSFDELAEDMMRPMLQEWLDNNLPTLVERLVREEIERVARGVR